MLSHPPKNVPCQIYANMRFAAYFAITWSAYFEKNVRVFLTCLDSCVWQTISNSDEGVFSYTLCRREDVVVCDCVCQVGRGMAVAALDMTGSNPWSRLTLSEYANLHCLREALRRQLHSARFIVARYSTLSKPSRATVKATSYVFQSFSLHDIKCSTSTCRQFLI